MNDQLRSRMDQLHDRVEEFGDRVEDAFAEVKPKLRGWLHAGTAPLALAAGITLVALSPTATTRVGSAIFALSALLVFTVSAIYHRGTWSPRVQAVLKRFDHSNIFLLISGTCTPFALLLLEGADKWWMLGLTWGGALFGVFMKVCWTSHPRWLSAPIYIALGWAPVFFFSGFVDGAQQYGQAMGVAVITLVVSVARSTPSAVSSTGRSVPTRHPAGSVSTRSSTASPSSPSSRTTSASHSPRTRCADSRESHPNLLF